MVKKPAKVLKFPRVPLPKQVGGPHRTKFRELPRKAKHKGKDLVEE